MKMSLKSKLSRFKGNYLLINIPLAALKILGFSPRTKDIYGCIYSVCVVIVTTIAVMMQIYRSIFLNQSLETTSLVSKSIARNYMCNSCTFMHRVLFTPDKVRDTK